MLEQDILKKKIQRLEWWSDESPDAVLEWTLHMGITNDELKRYVAQYSLDPLYVYKRICYNIPAQDRFFRPQEVIDEMCLDLEKSLCEKDNSTERFCFITCCNNDYEYDEMKAWIDRLWIPEGIEVEFIKITEAQSMCTGYNEAMRSSSAKYKVYMHQDVRILNPFFIFDVIDVFERHPKAGMIGMMGTVNVPESGVMWQSERYGAVIHVETGEDGVAETFNECVDYGNDFSAALTDGFMIVTQNDILWREDIFKGWHFYDASQSMEFRKRGYEIIIPRQKMAWCMHDFKGINWDGYEENRRIFVDNYSDFIY
ncbi:glycosyltransferase family protein [Butyrivibrio sp. YAB3001]|uniref:glycosyltransferase family protein n=1 Tax=Butyrivibrio sp. YAB3001 TaxID=1520812 RepID=UPI000A9CA2BF|nr:glycosyltransferase family protein [Butyrivibrio sp. YAB3001]